MSRSRNPCPSRAAKRLRSCLWVQRPGASCKGIQSGVAPGGGSSHSGVGCQASRPALEAGARWFESSSRNAGTCLRSSRGQSVTLVRGEGRGSNPGGGSVNRGAVLSAPEPCAVDLDKHRAGPCRQFQHGGNGRQCGRGASGSATPSQGVGGGFEPRRPLAKSMRLRLSGRASPCQGEGRGFESRQPLVAARAGLTPPLAGGQERLSPRAHLCAGGGSQVDTPVPETGAERRAGSIPARRTRGAVAWSGRTGAGC